MIDTATKPSSSGCPHNAIGEEFNPFHGKQLEDPYPFYARARREQPVFFSSLLKMWYVARYDDTVAVLGDPGWFSSADAVNVPLDYTPETRRAIETSFLSHSSLTNNDPPSHTLIRRLVNTAFTTRRVADLESRVRAIANDLIDGFVSRGQAETVARLLESQQYWTELIEKRAVRPRNDLVTALVAAAREEETPISLYQVINACSVIALAGHETTTNLLGNCLYRLLSMPEQWELVCSDHANIPKAIEETLRRYLCARAHAHDH